MQQLFVIILLLIGCNHNIFAQKKSEQFIQAPESLTQQKVTYNAAYFAIKYPNGDIPSEYGVCADVVIRAYRKIGIDLQKEVHEDMLKHFHLYPKAWKLQHTDTNIDHRRVLNLMTFFKRKGIELSTTEIAGDYTPGDIVCWRLPNNLTHIGIVINKQSTDKHRHLIIHNIGRGQELSDCLFKFKIIGHYRYGISH
ncbi:MAG: DUF1287 domain-containing protein [Chitinophagaceae bacterium]